MNTKQQIEHEVLCKLKKVFMLLRSNECIWEDVKISIDPNTRIITVKVIATLVCQIVDDKLVYWVNGNWFYQVDDLIQNLKRQQEITRTNAIWQQR